MVGRIVLTAVLAGLVSGVFLWSAHMVKTTPLILAAEVYEKGAGATGTDHPHADKTEAARPHTHAPPAAGFERAAYTLLADLVSAVGFAFLLTAAVSLKATPIDWRLGILWGLSGYAAFFLAPSLGLPPELPGMQAAELGARQTWWLATAVATAIGLGLAAFSPRRVAQALGVGLVVLPHVIGAPAHEVGQSNVPAELAAQFVITTSVVSGLFWIVLGGLTGYFYNRFGNS
ncbi:MAG: CbtA family protein [Proteobacteria bacterium]|nr:CbtA family protein [Pseudomonadota bacterium]